MENFQGFGVDLKQSRVPGTFGYIRDSLSVLGAGKQSEGGLRAPDRGRLHVRCPTLRRQALRLPLLRGLRWPGFPLRKPPSLLCTSLPFFPSCSFLAQRLLTVILQLSGPSRMHQYSPRLPLRMHHYSAKSPADDLFLFCLHRPVRHEHHATLAEQRLKLQNAGVLKPLKWKQVMVRWSGYLTRISAFVCGGQ